jgi:recombination protein RecA
MFGNPETTTGGNALKFYSSVRLDIRKIGPIKDGEEILGNHTRVKVVKNKVAPPFRKATSCTVKASLSPEKLSIWG